MYLREQTGQQERLISLENELASAMQELADTRQELAAIHRFSETLRTEHHTDILCEMIADEVRSTLHVGTVRVLLHEPETGSFKTAACTGEGDLLAPARRVGPHDGILWRAVTSGTPIIACDVRENDGKPLCAAPLTVKGKTIGVVCAQDLLDGREFTHKDLKLLTTIAGQAAITLENAVLYENLENLFVCIVRSFAAALDAKSAWTAGHSERVTNYSVAIAEELGLEQSYLNDIRTCGLLHDVGKIGISESILDKRGTISVNEREMIQEHTLKGAAILEHISTFETILPGIKHHHERWDGTGSPDSLGGESIPLMARILAVADSYDAITSNRPYRKKRQRVEAVQEIKKCAGTQFDPAVVDAFLRAVQHGRIL